MVNSQEFGKRLQIIMNHYGISATVFAENLGINRSTISHLLSGRNKPSLDVVMKVLETYPEVELYWLLNGSGNFPSTLTKESNLPPMEERRPPASKTKRSHPAAQSLISDSEKQVERVVIFFSDGTFKSYQ